MHLSVGETLLTGILAAGASFLLGTLLAATVEK